jgi:hypothetical protein
MNIFLKSNNIDFLGFNLVLGCVQKDDKSDISKSDPAISDGGATTVLSHLQMLVSKIFSW